MGFDRVINRALGNKEIYYFVFELPETFIRQGSYACKSASLDADKRNPLAN